MRYLLTLNIIQRACLAIGDEDKPSWFFIREIAGFLRRGFVHLYMIKNDHVQALEAINDPILKEDLAKDPRSLRDLLLIINHVSCIERSREILERARDFRISAADAIRLAAALNLDVDGIVSLEPKDFVHHPPDLEEIAREGKGYVLVERVENLDRVEGEDEVRILVTTPYTFIEEICTSINLAGGESSSQDDSSSAEEDEACDSQLVDVSQFAVVAWELILDQDRVRQVFVEIEDQFGYRRSYKSEGVAGEIDSILLAIDQCVKQLVSLPKFYLHYTVTSAQGIPSPVKVEIGLLYDNKIFMGIDSGSSTLNCTIDAYVSALNKVLRYSACSE